MKECIRYVFFALIVLALPVFVMPAAAIDISEDITSDTVWTRDLSPYTVTGDIDIEKGVTLIIEPGVTVEFAAGSSTSDGYSLTVNGTLTARGTVDALITFTAQDPGYAWDHIEFTDTAPIWDDVSETGSILEYCMIEHGGNGSDGPHGQAAVLATSASLTLTDSIVRYSKGGGVICYGGVQDIRNNRIHDTDTGIRLIEPLAARIENNYLVENDRGMAVDSASDGVTISGNTVVNTSDESYGSCLGLTLLFHDILSSYFWEQIGGPEVTLDDDEAIYPVFTVPDLSEDAQFIFQLTVTNWEGLVSVDTVTISAGWDNLPPTADAGEDTSVTEGDLVVLDASDSFDSDDGIATTTWIQTSPDPTAHPSEDVGLATSSETQLASFTAPAVSGATDDVYVFQVTVTDTGGLSDSATVVVRVSDSSEHPEPVAEAGPLQTVNEGTPVTLAGSILNDPSDNVTVVSWLWEQTEGDNVTLAGTTAQDATFTVADVTAEGASYTFLLTVTDDQLRKSTDTVIVNVLDLVGPDPNQAPTAVADVSTGTVEEGTANVILDGYTNSTDPELNIETYAWEQVSGPTVTLTSTGSEGEKKFTAPDVTEDVTLVFRLTVTDVGGLRDVDEVSVTVTWVNEPPVAEAGADQDVDEGRRVLLDGSASTDDREITSYLWAQVSGTAVTLFNATRDKCYFATPDVTEDETLVFSLTVGDGAFLDTDIVHVTVPAEDGGPVADAGEDRMVAYGAAVTLDGTASEDPDDPVTGIVEWLWEQTGGTDVTLLDASSDTPNFTAPAQGDEDYVSLTFQLTVKDGDGQEAIDTVVVTVTDNPTGTPPVAHAGDDRTVAVGTDVTLSAAGSTDPDSMPVLTITNNDFSTDDENETANAVSLTEDEDANAVPALTGNNLVQAGGAYLTYLYGISSLAGDVNMTGNWWGTAVADEIAALVYDGTDNPLLPLVDTTGYLAQAVASAGSSLPYPPMAEVEDEMTVDPDEHVTLDGSGTYDPDESLTYLWEQIAGKTVSIDDADAAVATFNAPSVTDEDEDDAENLTFRLTVTDALGFSDSAEIDVTVNVEEDEDAPEYKSSGCFIGTGLNGGLF